jgi:hypothetical protein
MRFVGLLNILMFLTAVVDHRISMGFQLQNGTG